MNIKPLLVRLLGIVLIIAALIGATRVSEACERSGDDQRVDEMLALLETANPSIQSVRALQQAETRQRSWSAQARVSYADKATTADAPGVNTMLTVTIPLFDRKHEITRARAARETTGALQTVWQAFLGALQKLCTASTEVAELETQRAFYRDRLKYQQQRVDEGLADAVSLWQYVEKAQQAEFDYKRRDGELAALLITTAREYGGKQWKQLRDLLGAMLN